MPLSGHQVVYGVSCSLGWVLVQIHIRDGNKQPISYENEGSTPTSYMLLIPACERKALKLECAMTSF